MRPLVLGAVGYAGVLYCHHPASLLFTPLVLGFLASRPGSPAPAAWPGWPGACCSAWDSPPVRGCRHSSSVSSCRSNDCARVTSTTGTTSSTPDNCWTRHGDTASPWRARETGCPSRWAGLSSFWRSWRRSPRRSRRRLRASLAALLRRGRSRPLRLHASRLGVALGRRDAPAVRAVPLAAARARRTHGHGRRIAGARLVAGDGRVAARLAAAMGLLVISNVGHARPERYSEVDLPAWAPEEIARRGIAVTTKEEYASRWLRTRLAFRPERIRVIAGDAEIEGLSRTPNLWRARVRARQDSILELSLVFYPGWRGWLSGNEVPLDPRTTGLIRLRVPAGQHQLEVRFTRTWWRVAADGLSLLSAIALGFISIEVARYLRQRRRPCRSWLPGQPAAELGLQLLAGVLGDAQRDRPLADRPVHRLEVDRAVVAFGAAARSSWGLATGWPSGLAPDLVKGLSGSLGLRPGSDLHTSRPAGGRGSGESRRGLPLEAWLERARRSLHHGGVRTGPLEKEPKPPEQRSPPPPELARAAGSALTRYTNGSSVMAARSPAVRPMPFCETDHLAPRGSRSPGLRPPRAEGWKWPLSGRPIRRMPGPGS